MKKFKVLKPIQFYGAQVLQMNKIYTDEEAGVKLRNALQGRKLVQMQRQFAAEREKIVTEGRDQGTVAFADAHVKFYLTADPAERAKRRQAELEAKGENESLEQLQRAIEKRDKSDRDRAVGPLKPAKDAIVVDTTNLSIDEVVERLYTLVKETCSKRK